MNNMNGDVSTSHLFLNGGNSYLTSTLLSATDLATDTAKSAAERIMRQQHFMSNHQNGKTNVPYRNVEQRNGHRDENSDSDNSTNNNNQEDVDVDVEDADVNGDIDNDDEKDLVETEDVDCYLSDDSSSIPTPFPSHFALSHPLSSIDNDDSGSSPPSVSKFSNISLSPNTHHSHCSSSASSLSSSSSSPVDNPNLSQSPIRSRRRISASKDILVCEAPHCGMEFKSATQLLDHHHRIHVYNRDIVKKKLTTDPYTEINSPPSSPAKRVRLTKSIESSKKTTQVKKNKKIDTLSNGNEKRPEEVSSPTFPDTTTSITNNITTTAAGTSNGSKAGKKHEQQKEEEKEIENPNLNNSSLTSTSLLEYRVLRRGEEDSALINQMRLADSATKVKKLLEFAARRRRNRLANDKSTRKKNRQRQQASSKITIPDHIIEIEEEKLKQVEIRKWNCLREELMKASHINNQNSQNELNGYREMPVRHNQPNFCNKIDTKVKEKSLELMFDFSIPDGGLRGEVEESEEQNDGKMFNNGVNNLFNNSDIYIKNESMSDGNTVSITDHFLLDNTSSDESSRSSLDTTVTQKDNKSFNNHQQNGKDSINHRKINENYLLDEKNNYNHQMSPNDSDTNNNDNNKTYQDNGKSLINGAKLNLTLVSPSASFSSSSSSPSRTLLNNIPYLRRYRCKPNLSVDCRICCCCGRGVELALSLGLLLRCSGYCQLSFHLSCAGISEIPGCAWYCSEECVKGETKNEWVACKIIKRKRGKVERLKRIKKKIATPAIENNKPQLDNNAHSPPSPHSSHSSILATNIPFKPSLSLSGDGLLNSFAKGYRFPSFDDVIMRSDKNRLNQVGVHREKTKSISNHAGYKGGIKNEQTEIVNRASVLPVVAIPLLFSSTNYVTSLPPLLPLPASIPPLSYSEWRDAFQLFNGSNSSYSFSSYYSSSIQACYSSSLSLSAPSNQIQSPLPSCLSMDGYNRISHIRSGFCSQPDPVESLNPYAKQYIHPSKFKHPDNSLPLSPSLYSLSTPLPVEMTSLLSISSSTRRSARQQARPRRHFLAGLKQPRIPTDLPTLLSSPSSSSSSSRSRLVRLPSLGSAGKGVSRSSRSLRVAPTSVRTDSFLLSFRLNQPDSDVNNAYCCVCEDGDSIEENPIILCDGPCALAYHRYCAGLDETPPAEKKWICSQECANAIKDAKFIRKKFKANKSYEINNNINSINDDHDQSLHSPLPSISPLHSNPHAHLPYLPDTVIVRMIQHRRDDLDARGPYYSSLTSDGSIDQITSIIKYFQQIDQEFFCPKRLKSAIQDQGLLNLTPIHPTIASIMTNIIADTGDIPIKFGEKINIQQRLYQINDLTSDHDLLVRNFSSLHSQLDQTSILRSSSNPGEEQHSTSENVVVNSALSTDNLRLPLHQDSDQELNSIESSYSSSLTFTPSPSNSSVDVESFSSSFTTSPSNSQVNLSELDVLVTAYSLQSAYNNSVKTDLLRKVNSLLSSPQIRSGNLSPLHNFSNFEPNESCHSIIGLKVENNQQVNRASLDFLALERTRLLSSIECRTYLEFEEKCNIGSQEERDRRKNTIKQQLCSCFTCSLNSCLVMQETPINNTTIMMMEMSSKNNKEIREKEGEDTETEVATSIESLFHDEEDQEDDDEEEDHVLSLLEKPTSVMNEMSFKFLPRTGDINVITKNNTKHSLSIPSRKVQKKRKKRKRFFGSSAQKPHLKPLSSFPDEDRSNVILSPARYSSCDISASLSIRTDIQLIDLCSDKLSDSFTSYLNSRVEHAMKLKERSKDFYSLIGRLREQTKQFYDPREEQYQGLTTSPLSDSSRKENADPPLYQTSTTTPRSLWPLPELKYGNYFSFQFAPSPPPSSPAPTSTLPFSFSSTLTPIVSPLYPLLSSSLTPKQLTEAIELMKLNDEEKQLLEEWIDCDPNDHMRLGLIDNDIRYQSLGYEKLTIAAHQQTSSDLSPSSSNLSNISSSLNDQTTSIPLQSGTTGTSPTISSSAIQQIQSSPNLLSASSRRMNELNRLRMWEWDRGLRNEEASKEGNELLADKLWKFIQNQTEDKRKSANGGKKSSNNDLAENAITNCSKESSPVTPITIAKGVSTPISRRRQRLNKSLDKNGECEIETKESLIPIRQGRNTRISNISNREPISCNITQTYKAIRLTIKLHGRTIITLKEASVKCQSKESRQLPIDSGKHLISPCPYSMYRPNQRKRINITRHQWNSNKKIRVLLFGEEVCRLENNSYLFNQSLSAPTPQTNRLRLMVQTKERKKKMTFAKSKDDNLNTPDLKSSTRHIADYNHHNDDDDDYKSSFVFFRPRSTRQGKKLKFKSSNQTQTIHSNNNKHADYHCTNHTNKQLITDTDRDNVRAVITDISDISPDVIKKQNSLSSFFIPSVSVSTPG